MSLPINLNFPELDVSVTIGNPVFCRASYLTGVHFRGELQHVGDVSEQKFKCQSIRTREIGGVKLSEEMYVKKILKVFGLVQETKNAFYFANGCHH